MFRRLKEMVYGNRIVLFAPLYIGNKCINNCSYCGFRASNKDAIRNTLEDHELIKIIIQNPKLLKRPIVEGQYKAVIGDPVENIVPLLK